MTDGRLFEDEVRPLSTNATRASLSFSGELQEELEHRGFEVVRCGTQGNGVPADLRAQVQESARDLGNHWPTFFVQALLGSYYVYTVARTEKNERGHEYRMTYERVEMMRAFAKAAPGQVLLVMSNGLTHLVDELLPGRHYVETDRGASWHFSLRDDKGSPWQEVIR